MKYRRQGKLYLFDYHSPVDLDRVDELTLEATNMLAAVYAKLLSKTGESVVATSGYRTPAHQVEIMTKLRSKLDPVTKKPKEYISNYGTVDPDQKATLTEEWVQARMPHVDGRAVDIYRNPVQNIDALVEEVNKEWGKQGWPSSLIVKEDYKDDKNIRHSCYHVQIPRELKAVSLTTLSGLRGTVT